MLNTLTMKIALCLYGQPRFFKSESYRSLKEHIVDRYNADVFFHTWWSPECAGNDIYITAPHTGGKILKGEDDVENELVSMYNPVLHKTDHPKVFDLRECLNTTDREYDIWSRDYVPANALSMYYSIKQVQSLKRQYEDEHSFTYDWVIMARFDHLLIDFVSLRTLDTAKLYVPDNCPNQRLHNDNFLMCSSSNFDIVAMCYDEMRINLINLSSLSFEDIRYTHLKRHKLLNKVRKLSELKRQTFIRE